MLHTKAIATGILYHTFFFYLIFKTQKKKRNEGNKQGVREGATKAEEALRHLARTRLQNLSCVACETW